MLVKICGITSEKDALSCVAAGADMLGFVFAESKRKLEVKEARDIIDSLQGNVVKVGVFQNQALAEVVGVSSLLALDYIQLHGDDPPAFCEQLYEKTGIEIIKAISIRGKNDLEDIKRYTLDPISFILLDSREGGKSGGTGTTFPWEIAEGFPGFKKPLIVAGGLDCSNVKEAIQRLSPAGVDVSTGVEWDSKPGLKDITKVRRFISEAKNGTA
jgi:phosphoribosylanthranilate isomerase